MADQKILVIDDSGVIRRTIKDMLPAGNFELLEAKDGVEGLNLIRQQHPNLIMLDFILPKMSGWDVFQNIQVQPELQKIPLVVMSGRKEEVTQKISEPFEYFEFIEKPFDKKVLVDAIKSAMVKAKKPRQQVATAALEPMAFNATSVEIQQLNQKIAKMQGEIDTLKKQLAQVVGLIKQKLK